MSVNNPKVEEAVLALLGYFANKDGQTWKRYEFSVMESLHEKGLISDPRGRQESVYLTPEGREVAQNLAKQLFSD
jgi:predicted transcriptional regulator